MKSPLLIFKALDHTTILYHAAKTWFTVPFQVLLVLCNFCLESHLSTGTSSNRASPANGVGTAMTPMTVESAKEILHAWFLTPCRD